MIYSHRLEMPFVNNTGILTSICFIVAMIWVLCHDKLVFILEIGKKRHGTTGPSYAVPESYLSYFESNLCRHSLRNVM